MNLSPARLAALVGVALVLALGVFALTRLGDDPAPPASPPRASSAPADDPMPTGDGPAVADTPPDPYADVASHAHDDGEDADSDHEHGDAVASTAQMDLPEGAPRFTVALGDDGRPVDGAQTVAVARDEAFGLDVTSGVEGTLHLHVLDLAWGIPQGDTTLAVQVDTPGRFPLEFHAHDGDDDQVVGYVEVRP